ncbi:unnamed protein product [Rotaria sordida]|uniref:Uncharacterized protein n=1 Tax=Rotaria sordida TaxID=392033 RepID=A0A815RV49_9BILA|nr:unnamed protein product [Rotaria sordida]
MDVQLAEKVFHFLIKILSIFPCVIEDTTPPIPPTSKITFLPLPASPGQLKKRFESINDSNKSGLLLILFIEQFVTLPYITALRLIELIVCRRIEMMLTLDEQILHN